MDSIDKKILAQLQDAFPIEERPYDIIADRLGIGADDLLDRISRLSDEGVIRRIGVSLNSKKLGFASTLAAVRVAPEMVDRAAEVIGDYCEVTHSYQRDDRYNIWFTVIAVDNDRVAAVLKEIQTTLSLNDDDVLNLPTVKLFKLDARFKTDK